MKVYLAGPDVFRPDALAHFALVKHRAKELGLIALSPFDNEVDLKGPHASKQIYEANVSLLRECDAVVANLMPFRGPSADAGTVFEIGFARALNKPVFGYNAPTAPYWYRVTDAIKTQRGWVDSDGWAVEDFNQDDNLMIAHGVSSVYGTLEQALKHCAIYYNSKKTGGVCL